MTIDLKEARRVAVDFGTCFPTFEQNADASHEWSKIWEDADFCLALLDHAEAQAAQVAALTAKLEAPEWSDDPPTADGFYWCRDEATKPNVVEVFTRHSCLKVAMTDGTSHALFDFTRLFPSATWLRIETP